VTLRPPEITATQSACIHRDRESIDQTGRYLPVGATFAAGTSHTVIATPNSGHSFVHWTENGRVISTSESYTFALNGNVTLVADFR
jgi:hypothetical protein